MTATVTRTAYAVRNLQHTLWLTGKRFNHEMGTHRDWSPDFTSAALFTAKYQATRAAKKEKGKVVQLTVRTSGMTND